MRLLAEAITTGGKLLLGFSRVTLEGLGGQKPPPFTETITIHVARNVDPAQPPP